MATSLRKHVFLGFWVEDKGRLLLPALSHPEDTACMHSPIAGGRTITESAPTGKSVGIQFILLLMNLENTGYPAKKWALK